MSQIRQGTAEIELENRTEMEEELINFYNQMDLSPNPSFSNLDACNLDKICSSQNQMGGIRENANLFMTPYRVKNILASYQDENYESHNQFEIEPDKSEDEHACESIIKNNKKYNSPSPSSNHQKYLIDTSSPYFESVQYENDLLNELSSTEKFDFFDGSDGSTYKQKLNYTVDIEDFTLNCTPNPFSMEAQKMVEKVFVSNRTGEIKKKKQITKKLFNKSQHNESRSDLPFNYQESQDLCIEEDNTTSNIPAIAAEEPNTNPHKLLKTEVSPTINSSKGHTENYTNDIISVVHDSNSSQAPPQSLVSKILDMTNTSNKQKGSSNTISESNLNDKNGKLKVSSIACKCRKSLCLKLYCECFARGEICGPACICVECRNSTHHLDERNSAIKIIESKNPNAFLFASAAAANQNNMLHSNQVRVMNDNPQILVEMKRGCNCRKSKCKKKYCECYMVGRQCTSLCQCIDCSNNTPHSHSPPSSQSQSPLMQNESPIVNIQCQGIKHFSNDAIPQSVIPPLDLLNTNIHIEKRENKQYQPILKAHNKVKDVFNHQEKINQFPFQSKNQNKEKGITKSTVSDLSCGQKKIFDINNQKKKTNFDNLNDQKFTSISNNSFSCKENKFKMKVTKKITKIKQTNTKTCSNE